ncbi:MAG: discoidin domain-containing protein, partial [Proteiniphilum sp.]|nr:discoidin domain-containing protein [Proteiniphilum sp.]
SRWVSPASGEHWLEVDLQGEYAISGFNSWTGNAGALSHPTKNFYFQAWIGGEWVNLVEIADNSDPVVGASFPEVTTSKVRYFVPDYSGNRVRLYELEVYSVVTF